MNSTEFKQKLSELSEKRSSIVDKIKAAVSEMQAAVRKHDDRILKWGCMEGYSFQDYDWNFDGVYFGDSVNYTFDLILGEDAKEIHKNIGLYSQADEDYYLIDGELSELEAAVAVEINEFINDLGRWEDPEVLLGLCSLFVTDIILGTGASVPIQEFITWWEEEENVSKNV